MRKQKSSKDPQVGFVECAYGDGDAQAAGKAGRHLDCSYGAACGGFAEIPRFKFFLLLIKCRRQANRILVSSFRCRDQTSNRRGKSALKSEFAAKICFYPRRAVHGGALSRLTEIGKAAKICFHERQDYGSSDSGG
jgi:hypothetical protein